MSLRDRAVTLVVPLALAAALSLPGFDRFQGLSVDLLFMLRNVLLPASVDSPAPSVAVVAIDEATFNAEVEPFKGAPVVFWTQAFAEVLNALVAGDVEVVGFDLILPLSMEKLAKEKDFEKPFRSALSEAAKANKVVLGARSLSEESVEPHRVFSYIVQRHNRNSLRYLNLVQDPDGVARHMPLQLIDADSQRPVPSMSLEMASRVLSQTPTIDADDGSLWLGERRIPARLDPQLTLPHGERTVTLKNDLLVDLYLGPASFPTYSLLDLYLCAQAGGDPDFFARHFAGKAVMLGLTAGSEDQKLTSARFAQRAAPHEPVETCVAPPAAAPAPRAQLPGVYLHAAAISNMVEDRVLRPFERHELAAVTAAVALLMAALTMKLSSLLVGLAFTFVSFAWAGVALAGFAAGTVVPLLHPIFGAGLTLATLLGFRFAVTDRTARHIRRAFGRVLAPTLVERMVKSGRMPTQGGELREITVFMSDLEGFTTISEMLPPAELVELLNEIYTVMCDTVEEHDGFVAQFIGDAVVAGFNVPLDDPDHARHGVEAALDCVERVAALSRGLDLPEGFQIRIRIGISTGTLLAGYIGSKRRLSYTFIGDDINLAARLEGVNKLYGSTVLVNEATARLCGPDINFREVDTVRVKGRDQPVRIFEPLGRRESVTDVQRRQAQDFAAALALFRARRFEEAAGEFAAMAERDAVARSFAARARELAADPPAADWDGVHNLLSK